MSASTCRHYRRSDGNEFGIFWTPRLFSGNRGVFSFRPQKTNDHIDEWTALFRRVTSPAILGSVTLSTIMPTWRNLDGVPVFDGWGSRGPLSGGFAPDD